MAVALSRVITDLWISHRKAVAVVAARLRSAGKLRRAVAILAHVVPIAFRPGSIWSSSVRAGP